MWIYIFKYWDLVRLHQLEFPPFLDSIKSSVCRLELCLIPKLMIFFVFFHSNITEMRKTYKDAFLKKHNMKLGFMSAFVKAAAYALSDQPAVNAGIDQPQKNENPYLVVSVSHHCFACLVSSHSKYVRWRKRFKFQYLSLPNHKTDSNLFTAPRPPWPI